MPRVDVWTAQVPLARARRASSPPSRRGCWAARWAGKKPPVALQASVGRMIEAVAAQSPEGGAARTIGGHGLHQLRCRRALDGLPTSQASAQAGEKVASQEAGTWAAWARWPSGHGHGAGSEKEDQEDRKKTGRKSPNPSYRKDGSQARVKMVLDGIMVSIRGRQHGHQGSAGLLSEVNPWPWKPCSPRATRGAAGVGNIYRLVKKNIELKE